MIEIQLTKGMVAIVDDNCPVEILQRKWRCLHGKSGVAYAASNIIEKGKKKTVLMHRIIMNAKKGEVIDHKDGNGINNTLDNLRVCTQAQNTRNNKKSKKNTSGFKGVCKNGKNYMSYIYINYKRIHLGTFKTKIEAAKAYNEAALKYHGEFANLNKID